MPPIWLMIKNAIITLPFTLTSILFLQSLSPMVIAYRAKNQSIEVARYKSQRAMKVSFSILFIIVFFFAISATFSINQTEAKEAFNSNISFLAILAKYCHGSAVHFMGIALDLFALITSLFGVLLGFHEACSGIVMNLLKRKYAVESINQKLLCNLVIIFIILLAWGAVVINFPILYFTSICSPIFGLIGCIIPVILVYKVKSLHKYKGIGTYIIFITGILLLISPFLAFLN